MNIFILDTDLTKNAEYYMDKHVVKIITEICQLMSNALWLHDKEGPYKLTHAKHPWTIWVSAGHNHFEIARNIGLALCKEYTYRYGKEHKCESIIKNMENPMCSTDIVYTPMPLCMPEYCMCVDDFEEFWFPMKSYRKYYIEEKQHLAKWKNRDVPYWYEIKE